MGRGDLRKGEIIRIMMNWVPSRNQLLQLLRADAPLSAESQERELANNKKKQGIVHNNEWRFKFLELCNKLVIRHFKKKEIYLFS